MPDQWDDLLAGLEELRGVAQEARMVRTSPPDLLPMDDVRAQLVAIEAAIGAIGASLGRVVVQLGEVRAMLDD